MRGAVFLRGGGLGGTISASMAAAFQGLPPAAMGQATSAINVVQRAPGALGSALLAVVLQQAITARLPGFRGGIGQPPAPAASSPPAPAPPAPAFPLTFPLPPPITAPPPLPP